MATVYNITFQLRRGNASVWEKNNPVLSRGEPGFVIDENRFKIGDGVTPWNELDYIGEDNIFNAATRYEFPSVGRENVIYKAQQEKALYQWNAESLKYEKLSEVSGDSPFEFVDGIYKAKGDINMDGSELRKALLDECRAPEPTDNDHVTPKSYVDEAITKGTVFTLPCEYNGVEYTDAYTLMDALLVEGRYTILDPLVDNFRYAVDVVVHDGRIYQKYWSTEEGQASVVFRTYYEGAWEYEDRWITSNQAKFEFARISDSPFTRESESGNYKAKGSLNLNDQSILWAKIRFSTIDDCHLAAEPTQATHPASKKYVDNAITTAIGNIDTLLGSGVIK